MRDNMDSDPSIMESRYRAHRGQSNLNVELGLTTATTFNSNSVNAATGGGSGVSGTGGINTLTSGTSPGGASCPEISQFILIGINGRVCPTLVESVEIGFWLWSPFTRTFEKVIKADVIENVDLWHVTDGLVAGSGSRSHPLIHVAEYKGTALESCSVDSSIPYVSQENIGVTKITQIYQAGAGTVKHLETEGPTHLYCAGQSPKDMFIYHNLKPPPGLDVE